MSDGLPLYPAYRPSGVPWLDDVPAHWEVRRLKTLCSRSALYGANVTASSYGVTGVRFLRTTDITDDGHLRKGGVFLPEELVHDYLLADGDVLISRSGTVGRSFLYDVKAHGPCAYAGYLVRFVPSDDILPKYVFLFTKTRAFVGFLRVMAISSTIENVNGEKYSNATFTLPPLSEQAAIVRYLDHYDRLIRRYLRAQRRLIALLEEQKQAIIHQAVTRGLDPDVPMKDSGVEWLGEVPAHWEVRKLGQLATSFRTGPFGSTLHQSDYTEGGIPVINPTHIGAGGIREDSRKAVSTAVADRLSSYRLEKHDLIFSRRGELGRCALVRDRELAWLCGTGCIRVRVAYDDIEPEYLVQALQVRWVGEILSLMSVGSTMNSLNTGILKSIPILVPPINEQERLLRRIASESQYINGAISATQCRIALITEYRTRLIADVVTGKVDVRAAAAALPGEEAHDEVADTPLSGEGEDEDTEVESGLADEVESDDD